MGVDFTKERSIKFLGKDFDGFKRNLMKFSQAHHSGSFEDFNESSPGMAALELNAYVGAVLAFNIDMAFNELRQDTQRQIENAVAFAKGLGYRPQGKRAGHGVQTFFIEVPATTSDGAVVPDDNYSPILRIGAKLDGPNGIVFETLDDVDFSSSTVASPRSVTGSQFDQTTGMPTHFAIQKTVNITAGETKTATFPITDFEPFLQLELPDEDVLEVESVIDSDGNNWYEVDYLPQEMLYDFSVNTGDDSDVVPYVLKLISVPRRFVTDRDPTTKKTSMVFGSGDGVNFDDELVPNLADLALPLPGRRPFSTFSLDPQNFLKTRTLGLSPFNTTLTVRYRVGGGPETNVPPGTIQSVREAFLDFSVTGLDPTKKSNVTNSLETLNTQKTEDGGPEESIVEVKANSSAFFAAQNRVVSREDVIARVMSLPAKFGKPEKVYVKRSSASTNSFDIHILSKDSDGHLTQASATLASNLGTYLRPYRILTTGINLLRTDIINVKIEFGVVVAPKMNRTEVLTKCLSVVRDFMSVDNSQIGSPIFLSRLQAELDGVLGVISVYKLTVKNVIGFQGDVSYSPFAFDVSANTANNIIYCPENAIFEVKFPTRDISGEAK